MNTKDKVIFLGKTFISSLHPLLGSALSALYEYRNAQEHRFIKDVVIELNTKFCKLESRVDQEYIKTEDFLNFLHNTLLRASQDLRKAKLKMFTNIIVNSTLIGISDEHDGKKYLFNETIDKLDENLFEFLLKISSRSMIEPNDSRQGWIEKDEDLKLLNVDVRTFKFNVEYLLSVGVLIRLPKFEVIDGILSYHDEYYVTQYGKEFVDYVKGQGFIDDADVD